MQDSFKNKMIKQLHIKSQQEGIKLKDDYPSDMLAELIQRLAVRSPSGQIVVLIDEFDASAIKPLEYTTGQLN